MNPDLGVESNQPPEPGSNPIPDPSKLSQVAQGGNYRRWDPNEVPTMVKAKPQANLGGSSFRKRLSPAEIRERDKKNAYFKVKNKFGNWRSKLPIYDPRSLDDCMPGLLADDLDHMRLALTFSLGLAESMTWSVDERIEAWSTNLIRTFGLGLKWEYFDRYCKGLPLSEPDHRGNTINPGKRRWEVLAGRLFFQDLLSLVTHESLSLRASRLYCTLARKLLISIWTRFGNSCTTDRGTVYQNQESVYGIGYYVKNTRCPT